MGHFKLASFYDLLSKGLVFDTFLWGCSLQCSSPINTFKTHLINLNKEGLNFDIYYLLSAKYFHQPLKDETFLLLLEYLSIDDLH